MDHEKNIFTFPAGLPGLPLELNRYALIALSEESPFFFLHSLQEQDVGFVLINPFAFFPDYEFDLTAEESEALDIKKADQQIAVFCIVNASQGLKKATINLLAPLMLNTATGAARQVVLNDKRYSIRHPLPQPVDQAAGEVK
ncbi:flagellar assembly protein FliW [Pelotomaculum propionicicum]|uniref:flagellar assembly protein FliW n=1 Tax=Pelotomaculum propionicicum TaxID=258475 RepID=UPI003B76526E